MLRPDDAILRAVSVERRAISVLLQAQGPRKWAYSIKLKGEDKI